MKDEFNEFETALWDTIVDLGRVEKSQNKTKEDLKDLQKQLNRSLGWIKDVVGEEE